MTSDELKLKELAEAGTRGKWESRNTAVYLPNIAGGFDIRNSPNPENNAAFIAAANPTAILSLLARIERLEKELQHIADDCADANPPSYGGIRQAALSAIAQQDKGKETV